MNNLIILIILIIILLLFLFNNISPFSSVKNKKEIVIARYSEDISWAKNYKDYVITCYNKGKNKPDCGNCTIITLENVGREAHTYIYHIIKNYDNLADVTVFTMGSSMIDYKLSKLNKVLEMVDKTNDTVLVGNRMNDIKNDLYNFTLDEWCGSTMNSSTQEPKKCIMVKSKIRPFGKWYESKFGNLVTTLVNYFAIFAVSRADILKREKSFYQDLLSDLSVGENTEVAHYFERSWEAVFTPDKKNLYHY
jgi:hypothetical protein